MSRPTFSPLANAVLEQARRRPDAPAIEDGAEVVDYARLDRVSAMVAARLCSAGVRPGDAVAVCLPRSWRLICIMLGLRRIGATVVPLDQLSPAPRRQHILDDSGAVAVIHDAGEELGLSAQLMAIDAAALVSEGGQVDVAPADLAADAGSAPTGPAFVFYTSGTTGRPKGVEVTDDGVLRLAEPGYLALCPGDRFACLSNPAFDALSFEVWAPLLTGGTCIVLGDELQSPPLLAAALRNLRIGTLFITVSLFNAVVDKVPDCFASADQILIGGEQLNAHVIRRWYATNAGSNTVLFNVYGPTEATTFALCHAIPRDFDGDVVPIGTALPRTGLLLRTEEGRVAGPNEVAELLLSGPALALGYRNLPAETERRFIWLPDDRGDEDRWYRTGDLVQQDVEGRVTYIGRTDRQVKVRGFRIEPGEVERQILACPGVRQAHVCTRRDDADRHELIAFLVLGDGLSFDDYDRYLATALPTYMRPHRTCLVDEFPRNANGKVDEAALLGAAHAPWRGERAGNIRVTATQREVLDIAEEVLAVSGLRPDDRWIPSGGDSLKALRFRFEVLRRFSVDLSQALVLAADFAALTDAVHAPDPAAGEYPLVALSPEVLTAPATSEQERLWLLHERNPEDGAYNVPLAFRLQGDVDLCRLRAALQGLVARHPALRTRLIPAPQGLMQEVEAPYDPWEPWETHDGERWEAAADRFFAHRFDLRTGRMMRATWLPAAIGGDVGPGHKVASEGQGILLLHLHHICVDGWSLGVLFRDLSDAYASTAGGQGEPLPLSPAATPLDFANWQSAWRTSTAYAQHRARLRTHYAHGDEPSPSLETSHTGGRPAARLLNTSLDLVRRGALDRFAAQRGQTRFQLLLSAFAWSLYGVMGQTRPLIAAPVAGRPRPEFADSVGMFANTVLLPLTMCPGDILNAHLDQHAAEVSAVLDGQEVALADVIADHPFRDHGPLFDFLFVLENTDFSALRLPGCDARPVWPRPLGAKCALTLSVVEHEGGFDCLWEYRDDIDSDTVEAAARLFRDALDAMTSTMDTTLLELVAPYRQAMPDHGYGPELGKQAFTTVAEGFAQQVLRSPYAPALTNGHSSLTYAELDVWAAELAATLAPRLPADPAAPAAVALYLEPSFEHVVALLAAARLNLTVVPLDPAYPPTLLRHVLQQAEPLCILVAPDHAEALDAIAPPGLQRQLMVRGNMSRTPSAVPSLGRAMRPLYTLFTSGSTGTPKGVQIFDRTLCNLLAWQREHGGLSAPAVTQQFSMLSFDVSFQEIFTTLCSGGLLRLVEPAWRQDAPALLEQLEKGGVERLFLPYVALQLLAEHGVRTGAYPSRLREVVTAGEQLVCTDAIRRWFAGLPDTRLFNHYGPTETHVVSALCLKDDPAVWPLRPAIGRPVAGAVLRVVDDSGVRVPPGVTGHLLIGGLMAERCYLGDSELNRIRFTDEAGLGTFYRSGDLARFDRRGLLHYVGRNDTQVKISGHRLELGQVEAALLEYPSVANAIVTVADGSLVACIQITGDDPDLADLTRHLGGLLPAHVRVTRFRRLLSLPRTPSGKLDRQAALTAAGYELQFLPATAAPCSPLEQRLSDVFKAVTGRTIEPDQRFFDAGASSLELMRFQLRCAGEDDLHFRVPDLFEHVTIRSLARLLGGHRAVQPAIRQTPSDASEQGTERAGHGAGRTAISTDGPPSVVAPVRPTVRQASDKHDGDLEVLTANEPVAIIGMAVRLPGAPNLSAFWKLVTSGNRGIEHFPAAAGRVGARSQLDGLLSFDPGRFNISPQDARLMDPQQRHLLMGCVEALAHAGVARPAEQRVGLVAACGESTYFQSLLREADPAVLPDSFRLALHHEKDFLATKAAYHLGLTGPAFNVQSACSSSLVGVHLAAGLLRQRDADVMLVGGVLVDVDLREGYVYRPQHILSPDGHCRPFSADAAGTVGASGVGVVVLKPLAAARRDGDTVYAVVTGSAVNNDGSDKLSYSAPSLPGQRAALATALRRSGRSAAELGYVEAHGTGTRLGDPVEAEALRQAYALPGDSRLVLSSVKSQIGHLGAAAGVVGMIRATLSVYHGVVPPTADFDHLNAEIDGNVFRVPDTAEPWPLGTPRVAAVSGFGIGGTNAHLLLELPDNVHSGNAHDEAEPRPVPCLVLSSHSPSALRVDAHRIADYLEARPDRYQRVLRHLQAGRPALAHRAAAVCHDPATAVAWLRNLVPPQSPSGPTSVPVSGSDADALIQAWAAGHAPIWPNGAAQAPWDFPPPAFALADYDFPRAARAADHLKAAETVVDTESGPPQRLPADQWLHQPQWTRLRRARAHMATSGRTAVVVSGNAGDAAAWRSLEQHYTRVVRIQPGSDLIRLDDDHYEADPTDSAHLTALLTDVTAVGAGVDWLHALPLIIDGEVGEKSLHTARWACLDTVAALCRALSQISVDGDAARPRVWLLSQQAQPVTGFVRRPESGLLATATEVPRQELGTVLHWADLPGPDSGTWLPQLVDLLTDSQVTQSALALRDGFWWHRTIHPVTVAAVVRQAAKERSFPTGTHLILGGTGGIGSCVAAQLLRDPGNQVILLARGGEIPPVLEQWSDRVAVVRADLAAEDLSQIMDRLAPYLRGLTGVIHAVGTAAGTLLVSREPEIASRATTAKLRGALLMEQLITAHDPEYVLYCSSMASVFGGVGQFDYAAAAGCLDSFACYVPDGDTSRTVRLGIGWDAWREVGMAYDALRHDHRHQQHLMVALTPDEGLAVLDRALHLQLPHLLVSTTRLAEARRFYEPATTVADRSESASATGGAPGNLAADLAQAVAELLGTDEVDTQASLYDLGADSLTLLELVYEVKQRYGIELELSRLSHKVSVTEILGLLFAGRAEKMDTDLDADVEVEVWHHGEGRDVLCLVHPVGGDIQAYRPLVSALDARLTVCLIADPALRTPQRLTHSITERAVSYLAALRRQFPESKWRISLGGWSFGAWMALSMAARAEDDGNPVRALYLMDPPPPGTGPQFVDQDDRQVDAVFARELGEGRGRELSERGRDYAERLAHCCRTNLAAMAEHQVPTLLSTSTTVWTAERAVEDVPSLATVTATAEDWRSHLSAPVRAHRVDADHYSLVAMPHVRGVADVIGSDLAGAAWSAEPPEATASPIRPAPSPH
ncbi:amino acid adenylation domain-containing protein [Streptomyces sp. NPDC002547]